MDYVIFFVFWFSLNSCKIFKKLLITESDYSNIAGATLLKSLSTVTLLVLHDLGIFSGQNTSERLLRQLVPVPMLWTLHSRSHLRYSIKIAIVKNFALFTGKHLCWSHFLITFQELIQALLLTSVFDEGFSFMAVGYNPMCSSTRNIASGDSYGMQ